MEGTALAIHAAMNEFKTWNVYSVRGNRKLRFLGTVNARNQPLAVMHALDSWPEEIQACKVQGGFSVRLSDNDPLKPKSE